MVNFCGWSCFLQDKRERYNVHKDGSILASGSCS
jgi:hypothetical protein